MPLSGQIWEVGRFAPQAGLEPFEHLLAELASFGEFPNMDALGSWVEEARLVRAPALTPLHFVEPQRRPRRAKREKVELGKLYDARITCSNEVPCLNQSYHDLFNALMFKAFPCAKRALHARQYEALKKWVQDGAQRLPGKRTREQDALTLFDEGGSVVVCPTELQADFARGVLLPLAEIEASARVVLFGHALFEHLTMGLTGLRSSARVLFRSEVPEGARLLEVVDSFVSELVGDPERFCTPDADAVVFFDGPKIAFRRRTEAPPKATFQTRV